MNPRASIAAVLVVTTVGATLAGCGGSKGLSRADIDAKASVICQRAGDQIKAVPAPTAAEIQDATKAATYFDKVVPIATDAVHKLEALKPDSDVTADWDSFITAQKAATDLLATVQHKADIKDRSGLTDLAGYAALDQKANDAADKVGATGCNDQSGQ